MEYIVNKWNRVLRTNRPTACPHVFYTLAGSQALVTQPHVEMSNSKCYKNMSSTERCGCEKEGQGISLQNKR